MNNEINKEDIENFYSELSNLWAHADNVKTRVYTIRGMSLSKKDVVSNRIYDIQSSIEDIMVAICSFWPEELDS